jgi:hypothetical protein
MALRFLIQLIFITATMTSGIAGTMNCSILGAADCISCTSRANLNCSPEAGYVTDTTVIESLRVMVIKPNGKIKEVLIPRPDISITTLSQFDINNSPMIRRLARAKRRDRVVIAENGVAISDTTVFFSDHNSSRPAARRAPGELICFYSSDPKVLVGSRCTRNICVGRVNCITDSNVIAAARASCKVNRDGTCPEANECANDSDVVTRRER